MWKNFRVISFHLVLFIITFITTTLAGSEWIHGRWFFVNDTNIGWSEWMTWEKFWRGAGFSIPFLTFLTVHEFGHYIAARLYKVKVSLPFYIPMWLGISFSLGTVGAFIQIKSQLKSRREFFDIGIAGPLAGFVVAFCVLLYGFTHLPPFEYIYNIHPEYKKYGTEYAFYVYQKIQEGNIALGQNLLFWLFENFLVADRSLIPHQYEMVHYPLLFAGYLGLIFTALNLIPIGQLDGGHILYGLLGYKRFNQVAPVFFVLFVFYAGLGVFNPYQLSLDLQRAKNINDTFNVVIWYFVYVGFLFAVFSRTLSNPRNVLLLSSAVFTGQFVFSFFLPYYQGYTGWFAFAFLLGRFLGVYHPPALEDQPLNLKRKIIGWLALIIFILCFSPKPLIVT
jgi:membrane-associated protease RseP (regulator of RpoE activity)